jgi:uncharacterized protein YbjT (DUF2867 family)
MKVFVVGAYGQIGQHLVKQLSQSQEHSIRAMVRQEEQASQITQPGIEAVVANLEGPVDEIATAAQGCDAIVFTAGSGGHTGFDKTLLIDLDGAVKTMEAAERSGIQRFLLVSSIHAANREEWAETIKPYYVAKHYADRILISTPLNYTIIRPGSLLNEPGTGKIQAAEHLSLGSIARQDVAATIIAALTERHTFRRAFDLIAGNTSISIALQHL